jgi:hypothetical protein
MILLLSDMQNAVVEHLWSMKLLKSLVFLITIVLSINSPAQQLSKKHIDSLGKIQDTNYMRGRPVMYVVNGIPYESGKIDSILNTISIAEVMDISFLFQGKSPIFSHSDIAIVASVYNQKNKYKRKDWKKVQDAYTYTSFPIFIDNLQLDSVDRKSKIKSLKIRDIRCIYIKYVVYKFNPLTEDPNIIQEVKIWLK